MKKLKDNKRSEMKRGSNNPMFGKKPWNYKGGTLTRSGSRKVNYIEVRINGKRFKKHRVVMEGYLGRELLPNEIVHHIDGNGLNNTIANLKVMKKSEHSRLHLKDGLHKKEVVLGAEGF